jgi:uncharacterized membrane protein YphA (DoxX/SURF4 family)
MDIVLLAGRILFAVLFILSAVGHLTQTDYMAGYAKSKGLPFAKLSVLGSGVVFGLGGLAIAFGVYGDLAALVLAAVLLPTAFIFHTFWKETDPQAKSMTQIMFNKDIALAGAALALAYAFSVAPGLTITGPLFN